jgi:hypothetical protein
MLPDGNIVPAPANTVPAHVIQWAVRGLEQQLGVEFPPAYRAFLLVAGNGCEPLEGSHYAVEDDLCSKATGANRAPRRVPAPRFLCALFLFPPSRMSRLSKNRWLSKSCVLPYERVTVISQQKQAAQVPQRLKHSTSGAEGN